MAVVTTLVRSGVAIITLDSPPVNIGNSTLRRELLAAVEIVATMPEVRAVVLASGLPDFYAGSDIKEFDHPVEAPRLPAVIAALEALPCPVVAALTGFVLGGGLEVTLGCDARIADSTAMMGLPEVTLGILPGAGGTVRLPRLVGVAAAIDLISSGRHITAEEALRLGLVDSVVPPDTLLDSAISAARALASKRRTLDLIPPVDPPARIERAIEKAAGRGRARPNVTRAVGLIVGSVTCDPADALVLERQAFDELRSSTEAINLRYLFFATKAAAKGLRTAATGARLSHIGIAGAGTMGSSIAQVCRTAGFAVTLFDSNPAVLERATISLAQARPEQATDGAMTMTLNAQDLATVDVIIDAVFEDMQVKKDLLGLLESVVSSTVVLASNTSYLNLDEISQGLRRPERLAGFHFFNPADKNPLVEVIRTRFTDDATASTLAALVRTLGKTGVPARVGEGFIGNRIYTDYRAQAEFLVEEGAAPHDVDAAMVALGLPIGVFAVSDMSGLDIAWARRKRLSGSRNPLERYVTIADTLCEQGHLGTKTGEGWYAYPDGAKRGIPSENTAKIIAESRAAQSITPRLFTSAEIQQRIICSMLVGAAEVLASGVAQRASDIDVVMTAGFAFPKALGGPIRFAAAQSPTWLMEGLTASHQSCPLTFALARPATTGVMPAEVVALLTAVGSPLS
ncbi:3-hydroxyacyl-CoA dehydrogenase NAD-binding domain-containing protein [Cryobacterium gelidum]|nr:3-hydroxyacyl-CoA dehydrogenase NAD-binding domain-containing protein [Cryobacterium gelidum]